MTRPVLLAVVLALVVAACGSRAPEEALRASDRVFATGAGAAGGGGTDALDAGDAGDLGLSTDGGTDAGTDAGASSPDAGAGAASATPSGGAGGPVAPPPPEGGNGGATGQGVTATEIRVGNISTVGGPLPGVAESAQRGAQAYFAYVNSQGGVYGRNIKMILGDDQLDPAKGRAEFLRIEPDVLAFVGGLAVGDNGYVDLVEQRQAPMIVRNVDFAYEDFYTKLVFWGHDNTPAKHVNTGPFVWWKQKFPNVKNIGFVWAATEGTRVNSPPWRAAWKKVGMNFVYEGEAGLTDPDYTPLILQMRSANVEVFNMFGFEINMGIRFARNMRQQNWSPPLLVGAPYYKEWYEALGANGDGWYNTQQNIPYLNTDELQGEAARSPGVALFLEWNRRLFPNHGLEGFTVSSWANAALFTEAIRKAGPNLNREKLLAALKDVHQFDAGGVVPPSDPGSRQTTTCFMMTVGQGGKWTRVHPQQGYECGLGEIWKYAN